MLQGYALDGGWVADFKSERMTDVHQDGCKIALRALTEAVSVKDDYTIRHSWRVSGLAATLATGLGWSEEEIRVVELAGVLHDIGKIAVLDTILLKRERLEGEEILLMRRHPEIGARMIMGIDLLQPLVPYVLYHHERWDGGGYPFGLRGAEVPQEGRLLALCDAFDAMTTERPYHSARDTDAAMQELLKNRASQFDPELLDAFAVAWESGKIAEAVKTPLGSMARRPVATPRSRLGIRHF